MNEIKGIAGKLVCYDKTTGHWFLTSQEKIKELQDQMNELIIGNPHVTVQDMIDILNENLPEDQKITTGSGWSNVSLFTDDFRYEYCGFRYRHNGLDILEFGFVPCESTEELETDETDYLEESIELARKCGVPEDKILHNIEEIDELFTK